MLADVLEEETLHQSKLQLLTATTSFGACCLRAAQIVREALRSGSDGAVATRRACEARKLEQSRCSASVRCRGLRS